VSCVHSTASPARKDDPFGALTTGDLPRPGIVPQKIATGTSYPSAVFTVTFGKGNGAATMVYEMQELFITSVTQGAADGLVTEDVSFVFKAVKWTFTDSSGTVTTGTWDVPSGAVL
jgi:type VI protein secretion system component Hcp